MTLVEGTSWAGLSIDSVRPYQKVRMLQQLLQVAQEQSHHHEYGLGYAVPNGSGGGAKHVHDGSDGLIIPIPSLQQYLGATLLRQETSASGRYLPLIRQLKFCGTGYTTWRITVFTTTQSALQKTIRATVMNASLSVTQTVTDWRVLPGSTYGGISGLYCDVTTTENALNVLSVEVWDGLFYPGDTDYIDDRNAISVIMEPYDGDPYVAAQTAPPLLSSNGVAMPGTTQHVGAYPFTSFDDSLFADDRAVASYLIQRMAKNEAYLFERLADIPAGSRASKTYTAHGHGGDTSVTTTNNVGEPMQQLLGCWNYGVGRRPNGYTPGDHLENDQISTTNDNWSGHIFAPTAKTSTTTYQRVAEHHVRLPRAQTSHYANSTGKLNFAALCYIFYSKVGAACGLQATMLASDGTGGGTAGSATTTTTSDELEILTITGLDADGLSSGDEEQVVAVDIANGATPSGPAFGIYSACLWLDP